MREILLLNASPRPKGTSARLAGMAQEYLALRGHHAQVWHLYAHLSSPDKLLEAVRQADALIISGPCYINTYPADTVAFLEMLAERPELLHGQDLYGIIQGGMPYPHTHDCGLRLLELFGASCRVAYKGGFVMGMGAILDGKPVSTLPNGKKVLRQLKQFFGHVDKGEAAPASVYEAAQFRLPGVVWRLMAWRMNRSIDKELRGRGIDPRQPSPYLRPPLQLPPDRRDA